MKTVAIVIEKAGRNYSAYAPEVPGCVATGLTAKEAEIRMREALVLHLKGMAEDGLEAGSDEVIVKRVTLASK